MKTARLPRLSESEFMAQVVHLAKLCGWMVYHTHDSRRSEAGFPDLVMVRRRDGRILVAELKVGARKATPEQDEWLAGFQAADIPTVLWTPNDWATIQSTLT